MKNKFEVEQIKIRVERDIQKIQAQISDVCHNQYPSPSIEILSDKKRQLMAQYNILLEVLT